MRVACQLFIVTFDNSQQKPPVLGGLLLISSVDVQLANLGVVARATVNLHGLDEDESHDRQHEENDSGR